MSRPRRTTASSIAAFAEQRRVVLSRTANLVRSDRSAIPFVEQHDALPETTALLMSTIELLKFAEEELTQQHEELMRTRDEVQRTSRHFKELFELAPVGFIVTDLWGMVHEANRAACELLRRECGAVVGKALSTFLPAEDRDEFRTRVTRLGALEGTHEWRARLAPRGDAPVAVTLTSRVTLGAQREDSRILWIIYRAGVSAHAASLHSAAAAVATGAPAPALPSPN
jgi:PAS domain S-box-containing protein